LRRRTIVLVGHADEREVAGGAGSQGRLSEVVGEGCHCGKGRG